MFGFSSNLIPNSVLSKAISTFIQNDLANLVESLNPEDIKKISIAVINRLEPDHLKEISDLIQSKLPSIPSTTGGTRRIRRYGTRSKK
jgi:hypothetical protein